MVAMRIDQMMQEEIELQLEPSMFWIESTSVLKYIKNKTSRSQTFIANRVATIRASSKASEWRYVNGCLNPADCVSRGISANCFLKNDIWSGPEFLHLPESEWPKTPDLTLTISDPEVKILAVSVTTMENHTETVNKLLSLYSQ